MESRFRVVARIRDSLKSKKKKAKITFTDDTISIGDDSFQFDRVCGPNITNNLLYSGEIKNIVNKFCNGYNGCILAYGQSSAGKTHSITGTARDPGIVPSIINHIFDFIDGNNGEYVLRVCYLEIYGENIRDLMARGPSRVKISSKRLVNEKSIIVLDEDHVFSEISHANKSRITRKTNANAQSSRSHTVLRITLEQLLENGQTYESKLDICDLAGSESADKSGSDKGISEMKFINKSLESLRSVVQILSKPKNTSRVPSYRDSVLTRLLEPSLSGKSNVLILCCISPFLIHASETRSTLRFASAAKKLKINVTKVENDPHLLLTQYKNRIEQLEKDLRKVTEEDVKIRMEQEIGNYDNLIIRGNTMDNSRSMSRVTNLTNIQELETLDRENIKLSSNLSRTKEELDRLKSHILAYSDYIIKKYEEKIF